jgi:hypothetical protein
MLLELGTGYSRRLMWYLFFQVGESESEFKNKIQWEQATTSTLSIERAGH